MMNKVVYSFWLLAVLSPGCSAMPSNQALQEEGTMLQLGGGDDSLILSNSLPGVGENSVVLESSLEKFQKVILKNLEQAMASIAGLMIQVGTLREENAVLKARMSRLEEQALDSDFAEEIASLERRLDVVESTLNTDGGSSTQMTVNTPEPTQATFETTRYWTTTRAPRISNRPGLITYILATEEGKILLADYNQQEVKVTNPDNINRLTNTLSLGMTPWSMTQLDDGTVVVTCENEPKMSFLRLNDYGLKMQRTIDLDRRYRGVSQCGNGSLYASSRKNLDDYPQFDANINIINREGEVLQTVMSGADYEDLDKPFFLTCHGHHLYISDWTSHKVLMLNVHTHRVTSLFGEMDLTTIGMNQPRVVAFDQHENMYVATGGRACSRYNSDRWCIIQVSPNGQWKRLDEYHSSGGKYPYGVAVTDTEIFISWGAWKYGTWYTYLTSYPLPQPLPEVTTQMTVNTPEPTQATFETTRYWPSTRAPQVSDRQGLITYILATEEGKILLADYNQQEVKVTNSDNINRLTDTLSLGMTPWSMTQLDDGTVVVTCENEPKMSFLRLNDYGLKMERTIDLDRRYRGVSQCGNGSLYASSRKNLDDYPQFDANINIINREGEVLQTVMSGADYEDLDKPLFLTCHGHHLYISDWTSHKVLMLNVHTHQVTSLFGEMDLTTIGMNQPRVVAFDQHENMYVATGGRACSRYSSDSWCIIQVSPNGQWKRLDEYHSSGGKYPYGVAVTDTEIFISWGAWKYGTWYTYLTSYPLPQPLPAATTTPVTTFPSFTIPDDYIPWGTDDGEGDDDYYYYYGKY